MLRLSMRTIGSDNRASSASAKHKNLPVSGSHFERGEMCRVWSDQFAHHSECSPQRNRCRCRLWTLVGKKERIMRYVFGLAGSCQYVGDHSGQLTRMRT